MIAVTNNNRTSVRFPLASPSPGLQSDLEARHNDLRDKLALINEPAQSLVSAVQLANKELARCKSQARCSLAPPGSPWFSIATLYIPSTAGRVMVRNIYTSSSLFVCSTLPPSPALCC